MRKYKQYLELRDNYPPWKIKDVDIFFKSSLKAKELSLLDPDIKPFLIESEIPSRDKICGTYGIYNLAILELLEGKVSCINEMKFRTLQKQSKTITDVDTILSIGSLVILETDDFKSVSKCYIGGNVSRLYNLVTYFSGLPIVTRSQFKDHIVNDFLTALNDVKKMGILDLN
ncbi:hypothetical protein [Salipaludibacillus agaradhaerens]|uniref:hypothetical protein n=1 Tax=Salipaludibacillus agaradhaerens TaxID=76935 RepID=UPI0009963B59|nr:hypothetical protein [Salipaludibacillus agaradhaerens]